jgi:hypothetical protein
VISKFSIVAIESKVGMESNLTLGENGLSEIYSY